MEEDFLGGFLIGILLVLLILLVFISPIMSTNNAVNDCTVLEEKFNLDTMYDKELHTCLINQDGKWIPEKYYTYKP